MTVSTRVNSYVLEAWSGEAPNRTRQQQRTELSSDIVNTTTVSDEINKIATVSNNPLRFETPGYRLSRNKSSHDITRVHGVTDEKPFNNVKDWTGEINKHVSDNIRKLLIENKCGLTSKEELSAAEAKLADSLNLKRAIRVKRD